MKRYILILGCFLSLSTYAATEESKQKFTAKIPDGTTIELVGLRYFDKRYLKTGIFHVGGLMALLYLILLISINELDERITTLRKN